MFPKEIVDKIMAILKSGDTCELKIEHGHLVIVRIKRKADKTEFPV